MVTIKTESGRIVTNLFSLRLDGTSVFSTVDGTGILSGNSTGTAKWLIIPTVDAAPQVPTRYFVGGTLSYQLDGNDVSVPLSEVPITVLPSPRLSVKYFHQRDVFSDDPFTPIIEPSIPYSLAVMVQNRGYGEARNFRITSAQPKIVDNEKGLLVNFNILATEVAGQALTPSLTATFGSIGPNQIAIGRWLLSSSLQGLFTDYKATWEHIDGLGNSRLSLIDEVSIHEMNHLVQAGGIWEDGKPDFLVNDVQDIHDYPDTLYLSDGTTNSVQFVEQATPSGASSVGNLQVTLSSPMPSGWAYLRVPDPGDGTFRLVRVMRSDGVEIAVNTNAWTTDRTFIGMGRRPIRENILHMLDYNSTGSYTLTYEAGTVAIMDSIPPESAVSGLSPASPALFQVGWRGADEGPLGLPASGIAHYDIFVSEDGAAFVPWLQQTRLVSATYNGKMGSHYAFYSIATDANGNREAAPSVPDAETTVSIAGTAPILAAIGDRTIHEGETLDLTVVASISGAQASGLTYSLDPGAPPGVILDRTTGHLTWATGTAHGGKTYPMTVRVTDGGGSGLSDARPFTVTVLDVNTAPSLRFIAGQTGVQGSPITFTALATDGDLPSQILRFSLGDGAPAGATIDPVSGVFAWIPPSHFPVGPTTIAVRVTDNGFPPLTATQSVQIAVERSNHPPVAAADSLGTVQNTPVSVAVSKVFRHSFDPDGDPLIFSLSQSFTANGGTVDLGPKNLTYSPAPGFHGSDLFTYQISDGLGGISTGTVAVTVRASTDPGSSTILSVSANSDGVKLHFVGIPGFTYSVQTSTDLSSWSLLGTTTVGTSGESEFQDRRSGLIGTQFYRLVFP